MSEYDAEAVRHTDGDPHRSLLERYPLVRRTTEQLVSPLATEDMVIQSMPDASPARWHLAHVSWFFEHFLLGSRLAQYTPYREGWDFLFNSYYYSVGDMARRPQRGLLSRPTVREVLAYRAHVDDQMLALIEDREGEPEFDFLVELGLNHEQQHQELILTDIKHALSLNPLRPAYREDLEWPDTSERPMMFHACPGGVTLIGAGREGFCFDNETPRHQVLLQPYELASRLVTNAEFKAFVDDGGYQASHWWLSDGWAAIQQETRNRPLYWSEGLDSEFSLAGEVALAPHRPVCHLDYYEADAYARWAGARLPTEAEWEQAAGQRPINGNLADSGHFHPGSAERDGLAQLYGDAWEWTASPYAPYPGFKPLAGSLGEYNGKFMCSQMVLRGGSCATPRDHIRASYRNFFYPGARWQFSGLRLARDAQ